MTRNDLQNLLDSTLKKHGITISELRGRCRKAHLSRCRKEFAYKASQLGFNSFEIAEKINRDSSTVRFWIPIENYHNGKY